MAKDCYDIVTNYSCNFNCLFCSQYPKDHKFLPSTSKIIREIYVAKKKGFKRIGFSGGESTIREDLPLLIKTARKVGFKFVRIQTNGYKLSDKDYCRKLVKYGLTFCKFTFLSHIPKIHNELTHVTDAFENSKKALENLSNLNVGIGINILVNKYNYKNLKDTMKFFLDKGASNFVLIYPTYVGAMRINYKKLGISLYEFKPYLISLFQMFESYNLLDSLKVLNVPYCFLDKYAENSSENYKFNTVLSEVSGKKWDIDKSIRESKIKNERICKLCIYNRKCYGINKDYIDIYGWKNVLPVRKKLSLIEKKSVKKSEKFYYTQEEQCIISIFNKKKNNFLTFSEIIKCSKGIPVCKFCSDGNLIMNAINSLISKGQIEVINKNGVFLWRLKKL